MQTLPSTLSQTTPSFENFQHQFASISQKPQYGYIAFIDANNEAWKVKMHKIEKQLVNLE